MAAALVWERELAPVPCMPECMSVTEELRVRNELGEKCGNNNIWTVYRRIALVCTRTSWTFVVYHYIITARYFKTNFKKLKHFLACFCSWPFGWRCRLESKPFQTADLFFSCSSPLSLCTSSAGWLPLFSLSFRKASHVILCRAAVVDSNFGRMQYINGRF